MLDVKIGRWLHSPVPLRCHSTPFEHSQFFPFQKEFEVKLEKAEKDARNLEEKLKEDIQQLQSQLQSEKVRLFN